MNATMRLFNIVLISIAAVVASAAPSGAQKQSVFPPLFQVAGVSGKCLVKYPGVEEYEMVVESRAYPYGSVLKTFENSTMSVIFSGHAKMHIQELSMLSIENSPSVSETAPEAVAAPTEDVVDPATAESVSLDDLAEVDVAEEKGALPQPKDSVEPPKIVKLESGTVVFDLIRASEDNVFLPLVMETAVGKVDRLQFNPTFTMQKNSEANILQFKSQRGEFRITGDQFWSDKVKSMSIVQVMTAFDKSFTHIDCERGEFPMTLECGSDEPVVTDLRPGSRIKIWRKKASVTGKLAVSMAIADGDGNIKSSFAFLQGDKPIVGSLKPWNAQDIAGNNDEASTPSVNEFNADAFDAGSADFGGGSDFGGDSGDFGSTLGSDSISDDFSF